MNDDAEAFDQYKSHSMTFMGKVIYNTKAAYYYRDGTFFSGILKWWHPLSWIIAIVLVVALIPVCVMTSITAKEYVSEAKELYYVKSWFMEHPKKLRWYDPYKRVNYTRKSP